MAVNLIIGISAPWTTPARVGHDHGRRDTDVHDCSHRIRRWLCPLIAAEPGWSMAMDRLQRRESMRGGLWNCPVESQSRLSWQADDNRDVALSAALVTVVARVRTDDGRPQLILLFARGRTGPHPPGAVLDRDLDVRVGDKILVPDGVVGVATLGSDKDDAILFTDRRCKKRRPSLPGLAADRLKLDQLHPE